MVAVTPSVNASGCMKSADGIEAILAALGGEDPTALCKAIEGAVSLLQSRPPADVEKLCDRLSALSQHGHPRVRRSVAQALYYVRGQNYDRAIGRLLQDPRSMVSDAAKVTDTRRHEARGDFLTAQRDELLGDWIAELEGRHPGAGKAAQRIARRYASTFVDHMGHELIRAASPVVGNVAFLEKEIQREAPDLVRCRADTAEAMKQLAFLLGLLDGVGRLMAIGTGRTQREELLPILQDATRVVLNPLGEEERPPVRVVAPASAVFVVANRPEMLSAFRNVIQNALDAGGGDPQKEIDIELGTEGERAIVLVRDRGCGMTDDVRSALFKKIRHSTKPGGLGLGMSVVRAVVEACSGSLAIETKPNEGTTIRIVMPTARVLEP